MTDTLTFENFLKQFKSIIYRRKERIVFSGEDTHYIYYILQGYVIQNVLSPNGNEFTPYIFPPNTFFPLILSKNNQLSSCNDYEYESITPVEVYKIPKENLIDYLNGHPKAALVLNEQLMDYSAELLKKLKTKIFDNALRLVVLGLLDLARLFGRKDNKGTLINYWFTHQDIANISGLSREVVTRQMNKLIQKKLISYKNRLILIGDLRSLEMELSV